MSDALQHECGIALVDCLNRLSFIKKIWNCFLRNTEDVFANGKQHNRGQDGAGFASINLIWNQVKDI
jgi:amidophosphoribosyltransferase